MSPVRFFNRHIAPWLGAAGILYYLFCGLWQPSGSQPVLYAPGVPDVPVAVSREALSEVASRGPGPGNSFRVAVDTPVRVLSRSMLSAEVELPDGRRGWIFPEWIATK